MTKEEIAGKIEWEGGVVDTILDYGLDVSFLPDDVPAEVAEAWSRIQDIDEDVSTIEEWLNADR